MKTNGWITGIHLDQYETDSPNGTLIGFDADLGEMKASNGKLISSFDYENQAKQIALELVESSKILLTAINQHEFFMEGYKNGSASISDVMAASNDEYEAYLRLSKLLKTNGL